MDAHRRTQSTSATVVPLTPPFSCFDYVEQHYQNSTAIHRCFSLGRSFEFQTLTVEEIPAHGLIEDENAEIESLFPGYKMLRLQRLAFWRVPFGNREAVSNLHDHDLIGYAIVKRDQVPSRSLDRWHVFEAVIRKYEHPHNCIPNEKTTTVGILGKDFGIPGVLYCQQNGLNKACAHVALRSLLSRHLPMGDISYGEINRIAGTLGGGKYRPEQGLSVPQIRKVLRELKIEFRDVDYVEAEKTDGGIRRTHLFQKFLYSGIESGCGGLLGFRLTGPKAQADLRHIIPFFGHTLNKDTWVPDADIAYFDVGGGVGYIPSGSWTSSFLGHDDNFGPNFCVPQMYVKPEQTDYVVELLRDNAKYDGVLAEAMALPYLYSLYPQFEKSVHPWVKRLAVWAQPGMHKAILRAVCVSKADYLRHLGGAQDWEGNSEDTKIIQVLERHLPAMLWVVEVSIPQLFPANERKVGDVILNALAPFNESTPVDFNLLMLVRVPGHYFFVQSVTGDEPNFVEVPGQLTSHIPLIKV